MIGHFDLDCVKYACSAVGEKRTILVTHKTTGKTKEFANRTEFYGRGRKKDGGWLAEVNVKRDSPWTIDEFDIEDIQTPEPIENVLHTVKQSVENAVIASGVKSWKGYIGKGESWRVEFSTLLKYKGNRENMIKPLYLDDVVEYLEKKYNPEIVTHLEVDDRLVIECNGKTDRCIIGIDKDYYGSNVLMFNKDKPDEGIVDCRGFGKLWLNDKGDVKGKGRLFKYYQACSQDVSDNYKANCFSNIKWGEKSAYNALVDCKNDKEAVSAMVGVFKHLYPEVNEIIGWRGEPILIDWGYVMSECLNLAHLWRKQDDYIRVFDVMNDLGVEY